MKKYFYSLLIVIVALQLSSCKKWLDVKGDDKVYEDEAFKDVKGFEKALAGVYNTMSKPALYGKDLEFGLMDVLAGYWIVSENVGHEYYQAGNYNYTNAEVRPKIDSIWVGLYASIRQVNIILKHVENINDNENYKIIKGEALGLRAFLHFELLKIFGPVIAKQGLSVNAIPIYTEVGKLPAKFSTAQQVLDAIGNDLNEALQLLNNDPIKTLGRSGNGNSSTSVFTNYNSLLDRRGVRMNYYAVKALLARRYLWEGNMQDAATKAKELITELESTQAMRLLLPSDIENASSRTDLRFTVEDIFSLYVYNHNIYTRPYFTLNFVTISTHLKPDYKDFLENLYTSGTGSALDYRLTKWNISTQYFNKFYYDASVPESEQAAYKEVQLINLPEMYFIAAEALLAIDPSQSVSYINKVRAARNIPALDINVDEAKAKEYLLDEIRREYIGEGMLFSYYKRWFQNILRSNGDIPPSTQVFNLPVPVDENIYNNTND